MRFVWLLQTALILFLPPAVYVYRHRQDPPLAVKGAGLILAVMYVGFFGLFVIGETFTDPGGWTAVGVVAVWFVPMVLLSLLAWRRPAAARPVLILLVVAMAAVNLWSAIAADAWRSFEDDTGPVRGVITLTLAAPLAVLAMRYVREAGALLLTLGMMPFVAALALHVTDDRWIPLSLAALDAPLLVIALLFLVSAWLDGSARRRPTPPGQTSTTRNRAHTTG